MSLIHSIRIRVLILVVVLVVTATGLLSWYFLRQFEAATTFELEQEGILLSNALEASIMPAAEVNDVAAMQAQINRLVATRDRNDIEINVIRLDGDKSFVVASNTPDNMEQTDPDEHESLLESLENERPVVSIELEGAEEDGEEEEMDDDDEATLTPAQPDYYLTDGTRILSITTPLISADRNIGSINVKLSLTRIDQELASIRWALQLAIMLEILLLVGGLVLLLNTQIFNPLQRMAVKMHTIARGDLNQRISYKDPKNEIGWLVNTFNQMLDKLQAAFERERRFTADVSHELRTPLTALKGRIGMTLTQRRTPQEYEATLKKLEKEVDRLGRLSNDLLFLVRLEQGQLLPHLEQQDFSDLLDAIIDQMQPLAEDKKICLDQQILPDLTIQGDADYLIRLFINLLDNAIKYSPAGGQVKVEAQGNGQGVLVTISDSGPGISVEHQALLFDRFYRAEADRSRGTGGAGLGLAIAAEIARSHQGSIEVSSKPELGTTFTVHLPT